MVIYEVNLHVENEVAEDAAAWLRRHILAMLEIDGFEKASWYYQDPDDGRQRWTVQYHVSTWGQLTRYFQTGAAVMRAEAQDLFGERMDADRRVLIERETFER